MIGPVLKDGTAYDDANSYSIVLKVTHGNDTFLFTGDDVFKRIGDLSGGEKGRGDSENRLRRAGFRELEIVTLEGMRHEILNEKNRKEVYRRILEFMDKE